MKLFGLSIGSQVSTTTIQAPLNPATEDIFYTEGVGDKKESFIPNIEYLLKEVKSVDSTNDKQSTSLLCTEQEIKGKQVLDTARLDSRDRITDPFVISKDPSKIKKIEEILATISNSWTSRDSSSNKSLEELKVSYGLGFVDIHDPACFSQSSGNRYLFFKLPLKNSNGSLIPIARTRNWRGEPVYLNPALTLGEHHGKEFILLKYRGTYLAIDHRGGVGIATNVKEPEPTPRRHRGWFGGLED